MLRAVENLTLQVSRLAWALETRSIGGGVKSGGYYRAAPCGECGSQLVPRDAELCPACLVPVRTDRG